MQLGEEPTGEPKSPAQMTAEAAYYKNKWDNEREAKRKRRFEELAPYAEQYFQNREQERIQEEQELQWQEERDRIVQERLERERIVRELGQEQDLALELGIGQIEQNNGLAWYWILLIVLGVLIVIIAIILLLYFFLRK
jgi:hypothetical protein